MQHNFVYDVNLKPEETFGVIKKIFPPHIKVEAVTSYQNILAEGEKRGIKEGIKKAIIGMLLRGTSSVPDIADIMDIPVSFVTDIRDALLREGHTLVASVRDFKA